VKLVSSNILSIKYLMLSQGLKAVSKEGNSGLPVELIAI